MSKSMINYDLVHASSQHFDAMKQDIRNLTDQSEDAMYDKIGKRLKEIANIAGLYISIGEHFYTTKYICSKLKEEMEGEDGNC